MRRGMQRPEAGRSESGFAMLLVFAMAAAIAITLYMEVPRVVFESQRAQEQLLIERGEQYQRGIQLFVRKMHRYPARMEELENTNNVRFLRKRYPDPMTGKEEWRLIHVGPGGVLTDSVVNKQKPGEEKGGKKDAVNPMTQIAEGPVLGGAADGSEQQQPVALRRRPSEMRGAGLPAGAGPNGFPDQPGAMSAGAAGIAGIPGQPPMPGTPGQPGVVPIPGQPAGMPMPGQPGAAPVPGQPGLAGIPGQPLPQGTAGQPQPVLPPPGWPPGVPFPGGQQAGAGNMQPTTPGSAQPAAPAYSGLGSAYPGLGQAAQPTAGTAAQPATPGGGFGGGGFGMGRPGFGQTQQGVQPGMGQAQAGPQPGMGGTPGGQNAAVQMIQQILMSPRPGGFPGNANPGGMQIGGGIAGVASTYKGASIMIYNEREKYNEWEFVYDMTKDRKLAGVNQAGGVPGTPAQQIGTTPGSPAGQQPGSPQPAFGQAGFGQSGFGQSGVGQSTPAQPSAQQPPPPPPNPPSPGFTEPDPAPELPPTQVDPDQDR